MVIAVRFIIKFHIALYITVEKIDNHAYREKILDKINEMGALIYDDEEDNIINNCEK